MKQSLVVMIGMSWLAFHFVAYITALRFTAPFGRERVIFGYHFLSFGFIAAAGAGLCFTQLRSAPVTAVILVLSIHGIYSLSFLELWSLSEGGYSLRLLRLIATGEDPAALAQAQQSGAEIAAAKLSQRIASLRALGLIQSADEGGDFTPIGRCAAAVLSAVLWLTAGRPLHR